jgi:hypothetical protein
MFFDARPDLVNAPSNRALFRPAHCAWDGLLALPAAAGVLCGPGWKEPDGRGWRPVFAWLPCLAIPACERGLRFDWGRLWGAVGRRGGLRALAVADGGAGYLFRPGRGWVGAGEREGGGGILAIDQTTRRGRIIKPAYLSRAIGKITSNNQK